MSKTFIIKYHIPGLLTISFNLRLENKEKGGIAIFRKLSEKLSCIHGFDRTGTITLHQKRFQNNLNYGTIEQT